MHSRSSVPYYPDSGISTCPFSIFRPIAGAPGLSRRKTFDTRYDISRFENIETFDMASNSACSVKVRVILGVTIREGQRTLLARGEVRSPGDHRGGREKTPNRSLDPNLLDTTTVRRTTQEVSVIRSSYPVPRCKVIWLQMVWDLASNIGSDR